MYCLCDFHTNPRFKKAIEYKTLLKEENEKWLDITKQEQLSYHKNVKNGYSELKIKESMLSSVIKLFGGISSNDLAFNTKCRTHGDGRHSKLPSDRYVYDRH